MVKLLALLLFGVLIFFTASDPFFGTPKVLTTLPEEVRSDVREFSWTPPSANRRYLEDQDGKVSDLFPVTPYYYPNVNFWFLIYTRFSSSHVVIHDKVNMNIIYRVLDFSSLHSQNLSRNILWVMQQKISDEKVEAIREDLAALVRDPLSQSARSKEIYDVLEKANVKLPQEKLARSTFFHNLRSNLRTQTGQRNFIHDGIIRSLPYQTFLNGYFRKKNLPPELLAIPFLESSFNPAAQSRAAAVGAWQFMPLISSYFVPKRTAHYDYRSNVGVASVAAAFLMSENFSILRSWDLAVTAYNSGTKHLLKTKRKLGPAADLRDIIENSDSDHFGFASKNFYSEFLALVHTLAYKEELFEDLHDDERADVDDDLLFFQTKCSLYLRRELTKAQLEDLDFHNHHHRNVVQYVPKGFIVTVKINLPGAKFEKISELDLLRVKPINWYKSVARDGCF